MARLPILSLLLCLLSAGSARAQYLDLLREVADQQGLPDSLLLAIAWVESRGVLTALNIQGDAYYPVTWAQGERLLDRYADSRVLGVGVMQVEAPLWGQRLGYSAKALYSPHVNIPVAARVLRQCIDDSGGDLWHGVGCYHSPTSGLQERYVRRVWNAYTLLRRRGLLGPSPTCVSESEDLGSFGGTCRLPHRRSVTRSAQSAVSASLSVQPLVETSQRSARLPQCPNGQPVLTYAGVTQPVLVFAPEQAGVNQWLATSSVIGLCAGCSQPEVYTLQQRLRPTQVANTAPGLIQHLGVSCVPTLVQPVRQEGAGTHP